MVVYTIIQSVPQRKQHFIITKMKWLMLLKEIIAFYSESWEKHKYKMNRYWFLNQVTIIFITRLWKVNHIEWGVWGDRLYRHLFCPKTRVASSVLVTQLRSLGLRPGLVSSMCVLWTLVSSIFNPPPGHQLHHDQRVFILYILIKLSYLVGSSNPFQEHTLNGGLYFRSSAVL